MKVKPWILFFSRDGKPFSMGPGKLDEGRLPLPWPVWGFKERLFGSTSECFANRGEPDDVTSNLTIRGIYYRLGGNLIAATGRFGSRKDTSVKNKENGKTI